MISDILRPHTYDNKFWRLVNRLMEVKNKYNEVIMRQNESKKKKKKG
jgi:hypothetical protein